MGGGGKEVKISWFRYKIGSQLADVPLGQRIIYHHSALPLFLWGTQYSFLPQGNSLETLEAVQDILLQGEKFTLSPCLHFLLQLIISLTVGSHFTNGRQSFILPEGIEMAVRNSTTGYTALSSPPTYAWEILTTDRTAVMWLPPSKLLSIFLPLGTMPWPIFVTPSPEVNLNGQGKLGGEEHLAYNW